MTPTNPTAAKPEATVATLAHDAKNAVRYHISAVFSDAGIDRCCATWDVVVAAIDRLAALALPVAQGAEPVTVEVWNGTRKVTIYPSDTVLRIWGANMNTEMKDEPWSHEAVNAAMRWLYEGPPAAMTEAASEPTAAHQSALTAYAIQKRERERLESELRNCEARIREQRAEINRLAATQAEPAPAVPASEAPSDGAANALLIEKLTRQLDEARGKLINQEGYCALYHQEIANDK